MQNTPMDVVMEALLQNKRIYDFLALQLSNAQNSEIIMRVPCLSERGARPVTNFLRNLSALSNWHSVYTSAIAFIVSVKLIFFIFHNYVLYQRTIILLLQFAKGLISTDFLNVFMIQDSLPPALWSSDWNAHCAWPMCVNVSLRPADLHVCCLARLGCSHVTLPGHSALVFKLPHCQVRTTVLCRPKAVVTLLSCYFYLWDQKKHVVCVQTTL